MNKGTAVAIIALALYLGFEAYAIKKAGHRTKPAYIYNMLVETRTAAELCNFGDAQLQDQFARTLARVEQQYLDDLAEAAAESTPDSARQQLLEVTEQAVARVTAIHNEADCADQVMKDYFQRFRIYARRSD